MSLRSDNILSRVNSRSKCRLPRQVRAQVAGKLGFRLHATYALMLTACSQEAAMRIRRFASCILALIALPASAAAQPQSFIPWTMPEVSALPRDARGQLIRDGRDLMLATYAHIGPNVADAAKRFAGNNLACTNCHLSGG